MRRTNFYSHRVEHRLAAMAVGGGPDAPSTPEDYRRMRRAIATVRREEQQAARVEAGIDRASLRALRAIDSTPRTPGRIQALAAYFGH